jgi:tight adherence protein B
VIVLAAAGAALAAWLLVPSPPLLGRSERSCWRGWPVPAAVLVVVVPHAWLGPALVLAVGAAGARALWRRRAAGREAEQNAARLAEVCDLLAAELSAGRPVETALDEAATAWPRIRPVAEVCRFGGDVPAAFREAAGVPGAGGLRFLAAAWAMSQRTGGGLGAATRRVAELVARGQATRSVVAGELASARATARLVAALPVVALLMGSGAGADPWTFLLRTPWGLGCLAAGLAVGLLGLWWIEVIAREVDR